MRPGASYPAQIIVSLSLIPELNGNIWVTREKWKGRERKEKKMLLN
jgi:hypothetical protein